MMMNFFVLFNNIALMLQTIEALFNNIRPMMLNIFVLFNNIASMLQIIETLFNNIRTMLLNFFVLFNLQVYILKSGVNGRHDKSTLSR